MWDAPTLQRLSAAYRDDEARASPRRRGARSSPTEVKMEREGVPTAYLDVSVQPVRGPDGADHLSAVRGARHHRAEGRAGAAPPEPEDGGAGPADRRHRARLQQSADGRRRRARHHRQARRGPEAQALCRQCAGRGRARRAADGAAAGVQPGAAARGPADLCRAADREHAAAAAQRARPGDRQAVRPRRGDDAGDGRPDPARGRGAQPRDQRPRRHARRRRPELRQHAGRASTASPSSRTATISS